MVGIEVRRFSPSGVLTGILPMPVSQPSSCVFGADGTLYVTSARSGLSDGQLASGRARVDLRDTD